MPDHTLFPSILPASGDKFQDITYLKSELERKEYAELQSIAAEHPSDDVHGRMSEEDLITGLEGKHRL